MSNSISIKHLISLNNKYNFYSWPNYDEKHTYDNINFYNTISCQDYLIYQLQFKKYNIAKDITRLNLNKTLYKEYLKEAYSINTLGKYEKPINNLNKTILLKIENKIINSLIKNPKLDFSIKVTLYCSKINGQTYISKSQVFQSDQILSFINDLNDKNGSFYNNKNIWDSICRVERGKVTNKMRFSIYKRDGYRCRICGRTDTFTNLEIDHIKPIAKGGKSTYDNLQTLCRRCNINKGDKY